MALRSRFALAFVLLGLASIIPSLLTWFRRPFIVTPYEFDFSLGLWASPGYLSPHAIVLSGYAVHILLFAGLCWAYYKMVLLQKENDVPYTRRDYVIFILLILPFMACLPWLSPDVFFYFGTGWIQSAHGINPYTTFISQAPDFPSHPIYSNVYRAWNDIITPYGPLFVYLIKWITWLAQGSTFKCLLLLKILFLVLHVGNAWLSSKIGHLLGMRSRVVFLCFLLNPALLFCYVGRLHNDILMLSCILAAIFFLLRGNTWVFAAFLALGAGFKYVPILMMPCFMAYILHGEWKMKRLIHIAGLTLFFFGISILPSFIYPGGLDNFFRLLVGRDQLKTNFIYQISGDLLLLQKTIDYQTFKMVMKSAFFFVYGILGIRLLLRGKHVTVSRIFSTLVFMFLWYFTVGSPEIHEWYIGWFLSVIFWINRRDFFNVGMVLSVTLPSLTVVTSQTTPLVSLLGWIFIFTILWFCLRYLYRNDAARHLQPSPLFKVETPIHE